MHLRAAWKAPFSWSGARLVSVLDEFFLFRKREGLSLVTDVQSWYKKPINDVVINPCAYASWGQSTGLLMLWAEEPTSNVIIEI